jgi:hypothetical protein
MGNQQFTSHKVGFSGPVMIKAAIWEKPAATFGGENSKNVTTTTVPSAQNKFTMMGDRTFVTRSA